MPRGDFHTNSAIAEEATGGVEHRLAADTKLLARAVGIGSTQGEIQKGLTCSDLGLQHLALSLVPPPSRCSNPLAHQRVHMNPEHVQDRSGNLGEAAALVLLPIPIGGEFGETAVARLAFAQFGRAFLYGLLEDGIEMLELTVQQTHLDHVVNASFHLHEIEGLADEIL